MDSPSENRVANLSKIPMELVFGILKKMNGPALLEMYKTSPWMSEVVEIQLRTLDPRRISLGKAKTIHLSSSAVTVDFLHYPTSSDSAPSLSSFTRLPIEALDSNIWRFMSFEEIHLEDNDAAAKYLEKIHYEKPGVNVLKMANCDVSLVVKALIVFKPKTIEIESFTGNLKEILPYIPIQKWAQNGSGLLRFPEGNSFDGAVLPALGHCQYVQLPTENQDSGRHFLVICQDLSTHILSVMDTHMCLLNAHVVIRLQ